MPPGACNAFCNAPKATYGVLLEPLEAARQTRVCYGKLWPLDQQNGWQIYLPDVSQLQPLGTVRLRAEALSPLRFGHD